MGSARAEQYSTKSTAVRTWSIRQNAQPVQSSSSTWLQMVPANELPYIYRRECRRNRKRWGNKKMVFYNVHKSSMSMKLASNKAIKDTFAPTQRLCMTFCAHNSLPTSAILALGLLKKKDDEQFCVGGNNAF